MANVRAIKSGNWSDPTTWNTGELPTAADDVFASTFTVTIDISPTVLSIRNSQPPGGGGPGGTYVPNNGITLTCTQAGVVTFQQLMMLSTGQSFTVVGNVTGGSGTNAVGIRNEGAGTINIVGNVTGGSGGAVNTYGVANAGTGTVNITGNVSGGSAPSTLAAGAINLGMGTVNVTGTVYGSVDSGAPSPGVSVSSGVVTVVGPIIAGNGAGITGDARAVVVLTGPFITRPNGVNPNTCGRWFWPNASPAPTLYEVRTADLLQIRPLYTADNVGGNPAASNVRTGTVYGPNSELTGTCAVPGASSVLSGVPVDATTGTAVVSAQAIREALGMAAANLDDQIAGLPTTAEILAGIDGGSSALAALSQAVAAIPTAEQTAAAVREEVTPELARVANCATVETVGDQLAALL